MAGAPIGNSLVALVEGKQFSHFVHLKNENPYHLNCGILGLITKCGICISFSVYNHAFLYISDFVWKLR